MINDIISTMALKEGVVTVGIYVTPIKTLRFN